MNFLRKWSLFCLSALFLFAGVCHFVYSQNFASIVPDFFGGAALPLVYITGVLEIAGGIGLLIPTLRRWAGIGLAVLLAFLVAANINMAVKGMELPGLHLPRWVYWLRPFLQPLLIWWALAAGGVVGKQRRN